jgi:hypothetical protein
MSPQLDHLIVPARDRDAAARMLAEILGVDWGPARIGPFTAVYVNDALTLDFDTWTEPFPLGHYCFRVTEPEFDAILARLVSRGLPYRSLPNGPVDHTINTSVGGRVVYWSAPDGHAWELLTESYARAPESESRAPGADDEQYAYFTLTGDFDPADITRRIGTPPTSAWQKGDPHPRRAAICGFSRWTLRSRLGTDRPLEEHIHDVLAQLGPNPEAIRAVSREFSGCMQLVGYFYDGYPGLHFDAALVEGLAWFGLTVDFDLYPIWGEDSDGG